MNKYLSGSLSVFALLAITSPLGAQTTTRASNWRSCLAR